MFRKISLIYLCIYLLFNASCMAEEKKDEWIEKTFDFRTVKTVAVRLSIDSGIAMSEMDQKRIDTLIEKQILKSNNQRVRFISNDQLEDTISKIAAADLRQLRVEDSAKYNAVISEYTPMVADVILSVTIKALGTTQIFIPESLYTYTEYQTSYINIPVHTPDGRIYYTTQVIQTPVSRTSVIPAHNENIGHAGAEFSLITVNNQQRIWFLLDMRDGKEKIPIEMTERIFKRAMDRFRELADYKGK